MSRLTLAEAESLFPDAICQMDSALGWMIHEPTLTLRIREHDHFTANGTPKAKNPDTLLASCLPHLRMRELQIVVALKRYGKKKRRSYPPVESWSLAELASLFPWEYRRLLGLGWHASAVWDPKMGIWVRATFYVRTMERKKKTRARLETWAQAFSVKHP